VTAFPTSARTPGVESRGGRKAGAPYLFLAPALVLFVLFLLAPILYSVYLSLRRVKVSGLGLGLGSRHEVWAGLSNYVRSLTDPDFLPSVQRVFAYGMIVVPVMLGVALLMALLLDAGRTRVGTFARTAIFLPYAVPAVVASLLWGFLYLPRVSPINDLLTGLGMTPPDLLSDSWVLYAVANIAVWGGTGFNMIVIYTSLRSIPAEVYEAARLDGATPLQTALRIKIPMVAPSLVLTFFFSIIATLQVFNEPTTLKPLTNSLPLTWSPLMTVYQDAFRKGDIYQAAAEAVIIAVATLVLSFGFLRAANRRQKQEATR
jgi:multiple sugar transport system permease protein